VCVCVDYLMTTFRIRSEEVPFFLILLSPLVGVGPGSGETTLVTTVTFCLFTLLLLLLVCPLLECPLLRDTLRLLVPVDLDGLCPVPWLVLVLLSPDVPGPLGVSASAKVKCRLVLI